MSEQRPWLNIYPKGIPANIDADAYGTLVSMIDEILERHATKPAFTCMGKTLTYGQIDVKSRQFGAYLQSRGLQPNDKVAIMMPNILQYPIAVFGALRAGLIIVNINPLYTPREMLHQISDSGAKAIIIAENFASKLESILPDTTINTIILSSIGEMLGAVKGTVINFAIRNVKRMVPKFNLPNTVTFSDAVKQGKRFTLAPLKGSSQDVILLQYTGGTTGVAKGAMLTNRNLVANMQQIRALVEPYLHDGEVAMCPLPLYHIFAFTLNCLALGHKACHNILIPNPRDLKTVVAALKKYKVNLMPGVNTLFNALNNFPSFKELDFSSLKLTVAGGMALQRPVAEKWQKITGHPIAEGYGLTETSPVASLNPLNGQHRLGSIGLPAPSTDMRIVDDQKNVLGPKQVGEIQIKGPQVMKGYYNRPDETAKVLSPDGWFSTGDIGQMHEDGFFEIVDRKKDMILVSGFNVYPNEVEEVIAQHPKVLEVAAVGKPDDKSGEVVKVFVVKNDKSLTEKELISYCREQLTGYKVPKAVEFRDELPKSNVGKILRRKLREEELKK